MMIYHLATADLTQQSGAWLGNVCMPMHIMSVDVMSAGNLSVHTVSILLSPYSRVFKNPLPGNELTAFCAAVQLCKQYKTLHHTCRLLQTL